jgi:hypothetical protein
MKLPFSPSIIVYALFMLSASLALSEERKLSPEMPDIMIQSYPRSIEQRIASDLSTPRMYRSESQILRDKLAVLTSFALIDYYQSATMFSPSGGYYEVNPIFGQSPSKSDMIAFGAAGLGLSYVLAGTLSEPWRQIAVDSIIASERMNIEENRQVYRGWNTEGPPIRGRSFNGIPILISLRF